MNCFDIMTKFMYDCKVPYIYKLFNNSKYPWDMVSKIKKYIDELIGNGIEDFTLIDDNILIGKNVVISDKATLIGPAIIGHNCEIRTGAFIRGNVITGSNCVLGNSSEIKNSIILDNVQLPHYNYVGDSVLGNNVHLGAGAICSNLKSDKSNVCVHAHMEYNTGLRKLGALLGDDVEIGCGCVLNPGTVIGKGTSVYPLTAIRGVIPSGSIVKNMDSIVIRKEIL